MQEDERKIRVDLGENKQLGIDIKGTDRYWQKWKKRCKN